MTLATATPWSEVSSLLLPALGQTAAMVGIVMSIVVVLGLPLGLLIFNTSPRGLTPHPTVHASISWVANLGRSLPFLVLMATVIPFRGSCRNWLAAAAALVVIVALLAVLLSKGSSAKTVAGSHFGTTLPVAYEASSSSERAFLVWLNQAIAPTYGLKIEPVGIQDGNQLDEATAHGQFAANIYQHIHWLNEVVQSTGMKLTAVGPVFQWAYSVYSSKYPSLSALPSGAQIALLNDPANTAQALWLLERAGEITFRPGTVPWSATTSDIASNPHNLHFVFVDYGAGPRTPARSTP